MRFQPMQAAALLALAASGSALAGTFEQTGNGIVVKPDSGAAKEIRLELMDDNIIHVLKLDQGGKALTPSLMTVAKPCSCTFTVNRKGDTVTLKANKIAAAVLSTFSLRLSRRTSACIRKRFACVDVSRSSHILIGTAMVSFNTTTNS